MKPLLIILFFTFFNLTTSAQVDKTDSLILQIDNKQLRGVCHYFWLLEMTGRPGWDVVKVGKPATNKLIDLLTDPNKGLIAHYILTNIWVDTVKQWSSFEHFDKDRSVQYYYNGLLFYEQDDKWHVLSQDMEKIKKKWIKQTR